MSQAMLEGLVYLNGEYVRRQDASISVFDRGFLLGDAVYEVIPIYYGKPFRLAEHLKRLNDSLEAIRLKNPLNQAQWEAIIDKLVAQYPDEQQSLYLQITRGISPIRDHVFPENCEPTVFVMSTPVAPEKFSHFRTGIAAITIDDIRWRLCRIKATTLLANVLVRQIAAENNALEAILVRDGNALEGAASNLFIVEDNVLITPPKGDELLPGITRDLVLEIAANNAIITKEEAIPLERLQQADEIWLTSSVRELVPVITLDHEPVKDGKPGPLFQKMETFYQQYKQKLKP